MIESMEDASLIALAAIALIAAGAHAFSLKRFSYPGVIAFAVGWVLGAGAAHAFGFAAWADPLVRLGVALLLMQAAKASSRLVGRAA